VEHEEARAVEGEETAAVISACLAETRMSGLDLARTLGLPAWTIHRWLAGEKPRDGRMLRLAIGAVRAGLSASQGETPDLVRDAMADLGMTARQLAAVLDVQRPTIYRWQGGTRAPDGRVLALALAALRDGRGPEAEAALQAGYGTNTRAGSTQRVSAADVSKASTMLAEGATEREAATAIGVSMYTLRRYVEKTGQPRPAGEALLRGVRPPAARGWWKEETRTPSTDPQAGG
jgi:transposase